MIEKPSSDYTTKNTHYFFLFREKKRLTYFFIKSWAVWSLLISLGFGLNDLIERYKELSFSSNGLSLTTESHLQSLHGFSSHHHTKSLVSDPSLLTHVEQFLDLSEDHLSHRSTVYLVDRSGKILLSTEKRLIGQMIEKKNTMDITVQSQILDQLSNCTANNKICDFRDIDEIDFMSPSSVSTSNIVKGSSGFEDKNYMLVVIYDRSVIDEGLFEDLLLIVLFSSVLSASLHYIPFRFVSTKIIPNLVKSNDYDALTGLPNRNTFIETSIQLLEKASNLNQSMICGVIDIDNFKSFNQMYGSSKGDEALCKLSDVINELFSESNQICGRLWGDRFIFLSPINEDASSYLGRIKLYILQGIAKGDLMNSSITVSIGAVTSIVKGYNCEYLLDQAISAHREAKLNGGAGVRLGI